MAARVTELELAVEPVRVDEHLGDLVPLPLGEPEDRDDGAGPGQHLGGRVHRHLDTGDVLLSEEHLELTAEALLVRWLEGPDRRRPPAAGPPPIRAETAAAESRGAGAPSPSARRTRRWQGPARAPCPSPSRGGRPRRAGPSRRVSPPRTRAPKRGCAAPRPCRGLSGDPASLYQQMTSRCRQCRSIAAPAPNLRRCVPRGCERHGAPNDADCVSGRSVLDRAARQSRPPETARAQHAQQRHGAPALLQSGAHNERLAGAMRVRLRCATPIHQPGSLPLRSAPDPARRHAALPEHSCSPMASPSCKRWP